jgi:hypothetical protein
MGRRKLNKVRIETTISMAVKEEVEKRLTIKYHGKPQYGAISTLVEVLLRKWIDDEVKVDPLRPESLTLNDLFEENEDGQVSTVRATPEGPEEAPR